MFVQLKISGLGRRRLFKVAYNQKCADVQLQLNFFVPLYNISFIFSSLHLSFIPACSTEPAAATVGIDLHYNFCILGCISACMFLKHFYAFWQIFFPIFFFPSSQFRTSFQYISSAFLMCFDILQKRSIQKKSSMFYFCWRNQISLHWFELWPLEYMEVLFICYAD